MKKIYYVLDGISVVGFTEDTTDFLYGEIDEELSIDDLKQILEFDKYDYTYEDMVLRSSLKPIDTELKIGGLDSEIGKVEVTVTGANIDFTIPFKHEYEKPPVVNFNLLDPTTNRTNVIKEVTTTDFTIKSSYFRTAQEVHYTAIGKFKK